MSVSKRYPLAITVFLSGMLCSVVGQLPVMAQSVPPPQTNPGTLVPDPSTQFQRENEQRREKFLPGDEEKAPEVKIDAPEPQSNVQLQQTQFHITKIVVEDATVLSPQDIQTIVAPYQDKDATLSDLQSVVDAINKQYRDKGYLTTQAYVPPQDIQNGIVTVKVVEGKIGKVCVTGNKFNRTRPIISNLDLKQGQNFNLHELETDLNRTNQFNSNYRLRATLSPGDQTGETNVRIDVAERQPWQITPTFDNQGRPFIGEYRGGLQLTNSSLFGFGDQLSGTFLSSGRTNIVLGSYFIPLDKEGDQLGLNYGYSHVNPHLPGTNASIDGSAQNAGILFSHPFDKNRTFVGDIGFNYRTVDSFFSDTRTERDEIRSIQAGVNFNKPDKVGQTFVRLQTAVAISGFLGGNWSFWKTELFLNRSFILPHNNILLYRFYGQYSPSDLPSAEAFNLGGAYSVRGYTEGVLLGDSGYSMSLEDRFPIPFLGSVSPWLAQRVQGAAFVDFGQAFYDHSNRFYVPGRDNTLAGAGLGLRFRLTQYLEGFADAGFGLVDRQEVEPKGAPPVRLHIGLRSNLLPTDYKLRRNDMTCLQTTTDANGKKVTTYVKTPMEPVNGAPGSAPGTSAAPSDALPPADPSVAPPPATMDPDNSAPPPAMSAPSDTNEPPQSAPQTLPPQ